ncbi:hypothetical protein ACFVU3_00400 [Streptomyces sp. NPDC058052]|uniref:hypothetical protein n=1 Tax=Streptomyces sp. NPDC058052 TaxID=3346316 RepID=UPI0036E376CA
MALAVPRTWVVGETVTAAYMNAEIRNQWNDMIAAWTPYTPTWTGSTGNPVLGNGTIYGRSKSVGKKVTAVIELVMGTTTTFGSGYWQLSLPSTAANPAGTSGQFAYLGVARAHSATTWYTGVAAITKNGATLKIHEDSAAAEWSATRPHAWVGASTNYLHVQVDYEAA